MNDAAAATTEIVVASDMASGVAGAAEAVGSTLSTGAVAAITGTMLRDMVACERRVRHDLHGDAGRRDRVSEFVEMLWAGGVAHEATVLAGLGGVVADLRSVTLDERAAATTDAMATSANDVILGARLVSGDLLGMPDVVRRIDGVWVAGAVKSGSAFEADGRRPRLSYAVQVAHYAGMLGELPDGASDTAFVIGRSGEAVTYDLRAAWSRDGTSLGSITSGLVARARAIRDDAGLGRGALSATCKLCVWRSHCTEELVAACDPTMVAGLGRSLRDAMLPLVPTVRALADLDIGSIAGPGGRTAIPGVGADRLSRFRDRARLLCTPGATPYARRPLGLSRAPRELHFDIEADPCRDGLVYLHGVLERTMTADGDVERFVHFFADDPGDERDAFASAFAFLTEDPAAMIYYYSKFERSSYRALQSRHRDVCSPEEVEALFNPARAIDLLFDVVMPWTEWPTRDVSIKTLAKLLGFRWGDADASGSNSIAWFDEYLRTGDPVVRERIIGYNHDDTIATRVVLDGLIALPVRGPPAWPVSRCNPTSEEIET